MIRDAKWKFARKNVRHIGRTHRCKSRGKKRKGLKNLYLMFSSGKRKYHKKLMPKVSRKVITLKNSNI